MSASLVGSEMCIRDSPEAAGKPGNAGEGLHAGPPHSAVTHASSGRGEPVSYTHLTLPTICSV
eukprot:9464603-Alexandrium_andersonii.AAC.1